MLNIISFYTSLPWKMKPVMNPMEMLSLLTLSVFSGSSIFIFVRLMFIYFFYFSDGWDVGLWYSVV